MQIIFQFLSAQIQASFGNLIIVWLYVGDLVMIFKVTVIFLTFISCICYDLFVSKAQMFFRSFKKRFKGTGICWSPVHICPDDVLCVHAMLDIVGWL